MALPLLTLKIILFIFNSFSKLITPAIKFKSEPNPCLMPSSPGSASEKLLNSKFVLINSAAFNKTCFFSINTTKLSLV